MYTCVPKYMHRSYIYNVNMGIYLKKYGSLSNASDSKHIMS